MQYPSSPLIIFKLRHFFAQLICVNVTKKMTALIITLFHNISTSRHFAEYQSGERAVHDIRDAVRNERTKHNECVTPQRGFASVCNLAESSRHTLSANGTPDENFGHLPRLY